MLNCCICGRSFMGMGHNPAPVNEEPNQRCCSECNETVVVPTRIIQYLMKRQAEKKTVVSN